jgi:hypothetical protein
MVVYSSLAKIYVNIPWVNLSDEPSLLYHRTLFYLMILLDIIYIMATYMHHGEEVLEALEEVTPT